jgi:hypothetical protein
MALMCSVDTAKDECELWSGQELPRRAFLAYLKDNDICIFNTIDDFVKEKELREKAESKKGNPVKLEELRNCLNLAQSGIKHRSDLKQDVIAGRFGYIRADHVAWFIAVQGGTRRRWANLKGKLTFMELLAETATGGEFQLNLLPTDKQASMLRSVLGLKKRPDLSQERRSAMKHHANAIRQKIGVPSAEEV